MSKLHKPRPVGVLSGVSEKLQHVELHIDMTVIADSVFITLVTQDGKTEIAVNHGELHYLIHQLQSE